MYELDTRVRRKPLGTEQEWIRGSGPIFLVIQELELVFGDWTLPMVPLGSGWYGLCWGESSEGLLPT